MNTELRWRREGATRHWVRSGVLAEPPAEVIEWLRGREVFVVSSEPVCDLHWSRLAAWQELAGSWQVLQIADGEAAKTLATAEDLWRRLSQAAAGREARLIGLGGGSVSDVTGLVAGGYLRGVEFGLVPTTTLAQVDAAVGGKSGVNLGGVKNVVGLLARPAWVIADPQVLATEDPRQRRAGLVEVVKLGCARDIELFEQVESGWAQLAAGDVALLERVIAAAVAAKIQVVERDPDEAGLRRVLNFGHSLGHALEAVDAGATLLHGEAVAWGMLFVLRLSRLRVDLPEADLERAVNLVRRMELPPLPQVEVPSLLQALDRDKKQTAAGLVWVLIESLGRHRFDSEVETDWLRGQLEEFWADPWMGGLRSS